MQKEATEKAVEAMMLSLSVESFNGSQANETEPVDSLGQKIVTFEKPQNYSIVHSPPSKPNDIQSITRLCNNSGDVDELFTKTHGLKMLFSNGTIQKTNIQLIDNEFEYYRLIGEAYNTNLLSKIIIKKENVQKLPTLAETKGSQKSFYVYVIDGIPQLAEHSNEKDIKFSYSKQVLVGKDQPKLFSSTCSKLKHNTSQKRQNECRLATGYFIVNQLGQFKKSHLGNYNLFKKN